MNPYDSPQAPKHPSPPWNWDRVFNWLAVVAMAFLIFVYVVGVK